jgi:hypothetical protein
MTAKSLVDQEFLEMRCRLLDLAASLDRIDKAVASEVLNDPRLSLIQEGTKILQQKGLGRAERMQMLFSDGYDPNWRENFGF